MIEYIIAIKTTTGHSAHTMEPPASPPLDIPEDVVWTDRRDDTFHHHDGSVSLVTTHAANYKGRLIFSVMRSTMRGLDLNRAPTEFYIGSIMSKNKRATFQDVMRG